MVTILRAAAFERGDLGILENSEMSLEEYIENFSNLDKLAKEYLHEIAIGDDLKTQRDEEVKLQRLLAEKLAFSKAKLEEHIATLAKVYNCTEEKAKDRSVFLPYESICDKLVGYAILSRDIYKVKLAEDKLGGAELIDPEAMLCRKHFEGYSMISLFYRNYSQEFDEDGITPVGEKQMSGAILLNHDTGHLVIVFAGTKTGDDWASNLNVIKTEVLGKGEPLAGLNLHAGFYQQVLDQLPQIENILALVKKEGSPVKISVTGHSLGGAMSTILAYHLKKNLFPKAAVENITFASPRVFSPESAPTVLRVLGQESIFRVFNAKDIVCNTPSSVRFMHVGHEIKMKSHHLENYGADNIESHEEDQFVGSGSRGGAQKAYRRHRHEGIPKAIKKGFGAAIKERERYHAMKIYVNTLREQYSGLDDISVNIKEEQDLIIGLEKKKEACETRIREINRKMAPFTFPSVSSLLVAEALVSIYQRELVAIQNYVKKAAERSSEKLLRYMYILRRALDTLRLFIKFENTKSSKLFTRV